jgi:hypothetical protein
MIGLGATSQATVGSHHQVCFVHDDSHSACQTKKYSSESSSTSSFASSSSAACSAINASFSLMNSPRLPLRRARKGVIDEAEAARDGGGEREVDVVSAESLLRRPGLSERRALRRRIRDMRSDSSSYESSS